MTNIYTRAQVKEHTTDKDCWFIIENKVYDVTKFLEEHPGGEEILLDVAGVDATEDFEDVGHSEDARQEMEKFYKGDLAESEHSKGSVPVAKKVNSADSSGSWTTGLGIVLIIGLLVVYFLNK